MLNAPCMARRDGSVTFSEKIKHVRVWELSRNVDSDQGLVLNYRILCVARTTLFATFPSHLGTDACVASRSICYESIFGSRLGNDGSALIVTIWGAFAVNST